MKVIPKFQSGGYSLYYITYSADNLQFPAAKLAAGGGSAKSSSDDSLSEKDFFDMVKNIDGLPNDMKGIISSISNIFATRKLTGDSLMDLSSMYLNMLYQLNVAKQDKALYDEAYRKALTNGALNEPAITAQGMLMALTPEGGIIEVDPATYIRDRNNYTLLSVSLLLNLRAYDPTLSGDRESMNIALNSVGFEEFLSLINSAVKSLGSSTELHDIRLAVNTDEALAYMKLLDQEGIDYYTLYSSEKLTHSGELVKRMLNYLATAMPLRVRTWAMLKTNETNGEAAIRKLAYDYLASGVDFEYKTVQTIEPKRVASSGNKKSSGSTAVDSTEKQNIGYWGMMILGSGENYRDYTIMHGNTAINMPFSYYQGGIPKAEGDVNLEYVMNQSGMKYMVDNSHNVMFGAMHIDERNWDLVVVESNYGAYRIMLPVDKNGRPDYKLFLKFAIALRSILEFERQGKTPTLLNIYKSVGLEDCIILGNDNKTYYFNPLKVKPFIVLKGVVNGDATVSGNVNNQYVSRKVKEFTSPYKAWVLEVGKDSDLYKRIRKATENNDINEGHYFFWFEWGRTPLYEGLIFIPMSENLNNAMLADGINIQQQNVDTNKANSLFWDTYNSLREDSPTVVDPNSFKSEGYLTND